MNTQKILNLKYKFTWLFAFLFLFIIGLWGKSDKQCISILGDEFGYWTAGAFFSGIDWRGLASTNAYFGFGYGLLLAPIMMILKTDPVLMYQLALLMNVVMLMVSLILAYKCIQKIAVKRDKIIHILIALLIILFPGNMAASNRAMTEVLMQMLYWIIFYLILCLCTEKNRYDHKRKMLYLLAVSALSIFMFFCHQRALVLVISGAVVIFLYFANNGAKVKDILRLAVLTIVLFTIGLIVRHHYTDYLYSANEVLTGHVDNSFNSIQSGLLHNIGVYGIVSMIKGITISVIGKLFYAGMSTGLFIFVGITFCIHNIWCKKGSEKIPFLYLVLTFLGAVGISAVFMPGGFETRTDILVYGRYIEYSLGPLFAVGLVPFLENRINKKDILMVIVFTCILSIIVSKYIPANAPLSNMDGNCAGIADMFINGNWKGIEPVFVVTIRAILILSISFLIFHIKQNDRFYKIIAICLLCIMEVYIYMFVNKNMTMEWQKQVNENRQLVNYINSENLNDYNIYSYKGGSVSKMIQFLMPLEKIEIIEEIDSLDLDNDLFLTENTEEMRNYINDRKSSVLYQNGQVILWRNDEK